MFVPVIDRNQHPLMPTTPSRARRWIKSGKATAFWKGGLFCVRLNAERAAREVEPLAVGIDPGSKREGYSVLWAAHTYLNIQAEAREGVKKAEEQSTRQRRTRRGRKTPCRKPRQNRHQSKKKLPPSTKARWQWKLRLARFLCQLFPVSVFVVEDIKARAKKRKRRWNQSFSPLEVGKLWFYAELGQFAPVQTRQGYETKALRDQLGFKKTSKKLAEVWEAHCVDAWVMPYRAVGYWWRRRRSNRLSSLLDESNERSLPCLSTRLLGKPGIHPAEIERGGREDLLQMDFGLSSVACVP